MNKISSIALCELENLQGIIKSSRISKMGKYVAHECIREIKKELTSPTEEEVCKALSEHFKLGIEENLFYRQSTKEFVIDTSLGGFEEECVWLNINGCVEMIQDLPPKLITMIGRFYEGLNREE